MHYVRNAWYVASWEQDLAPEKPLAITILNEPIVVWRTASGKLNALENRCVHRLAALSLGRCEGEQLRCMYHGMLYDPDGRVVEIPGQALIPKHARVRAYPVVQRDSWIWVWMGDADAADETLIPPAIGFDDPDYILGAGHLDYDAEARLINDNLLDFSHLSYVHANSFGTGMEFAQEPPQIEQIPRGIRYIRWVSGAVSEDGTPQPELYQTYDYSLPGILVMWFGLFPPGAKARMNGGPPNKDDAIAMYVVTSQAVTPMTDKTTRYFFSTGPLARLGSEAVRDDWVQRTYTAFAEDKAMIEAQQGIIDLTPSPAIMATLHDRAVTMFNRLVDQLVAQETADKAQQVA